MNQSIYQCRGRFLVQLHDQTIGCTRTDLDDLSLESQVADQQLIDNNCYANK